MYNKQTNKHTHNFVLCWRDLSGSDAIPQSMPLDLVHVAYLCKENLFLVFHRDQAPDLARVGAWHSAGTYTGIMAQSFVYEPGVERRKTEMREILRVLISQ